MEDDPHRVKTFCYKHTPGPTRKMGKYRICYWDGNGNSIDYPIDVCLDCGTLYVSQENLEKVKKSEYSDES